MSKKFVLIVFALCLLFSIQNFALAISTVDSNLTTQPFLIEKQGIKQTVKFVTAKSSSKGSDLSVQSVPSSMEWGYLYGSSGNDQIGTIRCTLDGGYIIAGTTTSFGSSPNAIYVTKTDSVGNIIWSYIYGATYTWGVYSVRETSNNGFIIAGRYSGSSQGFYLLNLDSLGNVVWSNLYAGKITDGDVVECSGGYALACTFDYDNDNTNELYIMKTDYNGNITWSKALNEIINIYTKVIVDRTTGYIIVSARGYNSSSPSIYITNIYKLNTSGTVLSQNRYDNILSSLTDLIQTNDKSRITGLLQRLTIDKICRWNRIILFP